MKYYNKEVVYYLINLQIKLDKKAKERADMQALGIMGSFTNFQYKI